MYLKSCKIWLWRNLRVIKIKEKIYSVLSLMKYKVFGFKNALKWLQLTSPFIWYFFLPWFNYFQEQSWLIHPTYVHFSSTVYKLPYELWVWYQDQPDRGLQPQGSYKYTLANNELNTVDPWTTRRLGAPIPWAVENPHVTLTP